MQRSHTGSTRVGVSDSRNPMANTSQRRDAEKFVSERAFKLDLQHALVDARDQSSTARKLERSPGAHHKAGKAWDRVAFLTKDRPGYEEVHSDAKVCAELEYKNMDALYRMKDA